MRNASFKSEAVTLRFDINKLLALFNEHSNRDMQIAKGALLEVLSLLGLSGQSMHFKAEEYTFDHFLHILGLIEVPTDPSLYVLSFMHVLVQYRDRCVREECLAQAMEIQEQVRQIAAQEVGREKDRLKWEYNHIYEELHRSQEKQLGQFEAQWKQYLEQFKAEREKKLRETRSLRYQALAEQQQKIVTAFSKQRVVSTKLRELEDRKKSMLKQKRYEQVMRMSRLLQQEKQAIIRNRQKQMEYVTRKNAVSCKVRNDRTVDWLESSLNNNLGKLLSKKQQGQAIMKIRLKSLREEAQRKLSEHFNSEIGRLKTSFNLLKRK